MPKAGLPIHSPAPAPDGPIACTLHPNEYAGRLDHFRQGVFSHLVALERPEPTQLRLRLVGDTDPEGLQELLVREQACCAFLSFTITSYTSAASCTTSASRRASTTPSGPSSA